MIQANELRIGNLVLDDEGTIVKIECLKSKEFNDWNGGDDYQTLFSKNNELCWSSHVFGIPLTSEILVQCGFEGDEDEFIFQYKGAIYKIEKQENWWFVGIRPDNKSTVYFCWDIYHVHQLQNLYYALTQTELTLTL